MVNVPENDESLADDIFGEESYEAAKPLKKQFLPWHRPRKQYVRAKQWIRDIARAIDDFDKKPGDSLRYLGLPGVDLLDLRYIHEEICRTRAIPLLFLGFNTSQPNTDAGAELNISLNEVRGLPLVAKESHVVGSDFRLIGKPESKAHRAAVRTGPFDVVNLDLCDCFAAEAPQASDSTHYDAMKGLITFQARRKEPWLLFLTTRGGTGHVHAGVLAKLAEKYKQNLNGCAAFRATSEESFKIAADEDVDAALKSHEGEVVIFLTALCKWMLGEALSNMPPTKVSLLGVLEYQVEEKGNGADLFSVALKFTPTNHVAADALGLAPQRQARPTECEFAPAFVPKIARRKDVDVLLNGDPVLHGEMTTGMENLLTQARYDGGAFRKWVEDGCPHAQ